METKDGLTQEHLVNVLHNRGYQNATVRQVADWRYRELLPPFDVQRSGRGRSQGRTHGHWSDEPRIVERSTWILELLKLYGSYSSVYVPLWQLGYSLGFDRIRQSLSAPLEEIITSVKSQCDSECSTEDALYERACSLTEYLDREPSPVSELSPDALALILNVFLNPDYDWTDRGAFEALQSWFQRCDEFQASQNESREVPVSKPHTVDSLMSLAVRLRGYLTVSKIKQAVEESTDSDLRVVQQDLLILRKMWPPLKRLLSKNLSTDFQLPLEMMLRLVFGVGKMAIWIDLSLRKNGFGSYIDWLLSDCATKVQGAFDREFINE